MGFKQPLCFEQGSKFGRYKVGKLQKFLLSTIICSVECYILNNVAQKVARYKKQHFVVKTSATFNSISERVGEGERYHSTNHVAVTCLFCANFVPFKNLEFENLSSKSLSYSV